MDKWNRPHLLVLLVTPMYLSLLMLMQPFMIVIGIGRLCVVANCAGGGGRQTMASGRTKGLHCGGPSTYLERAGILVPTQKFKERLACKGEWGFVWCQLSDCHIMENEKQRRDQQNSPPRRWKIIKCRVGSTITAVMVSSFDCITGNSTLDDRSMVIWKRSSEVWDSRSMGILSDACGISQWRKTNCALWLKKNVLYSTSLQLYDFL